MSGVLGTGGGVIDGCPGPGMLGTGRWGVGGAQGAGDSDVLGILVSTVLGDLVFGGAPSPTPHCSAAPPSHSARCLSPPDATTMAGSQGCGEGKIAGLYDLERTLGKGHFAVVKLARHVFTGQRVAIKVIDKSKLAGEAAGQLLQEVRCMKLVQHPNVVRLYEVIDTHAKLYLILELGDGGDMFDHIMRHEGGLAETRAKHYFAQIVHAISYCHKLHVVHRDLKPENVVFFQEQGVVKLTDFGFSNRFQPGKMLTTSCGSLAYSAPEILLGDEYDAPAVGKGSGAQPQTCLPCAPCPEHGPACWVPPHFWPLGWEHPCPSGTAVPTGSNPVPLGARVPRPALAQGGSHCGDHPCTHRDPTE